MKLFIVLFFAMVASSGSAEILKSTCKNSDFQSIRMALNSANIIITESQPDLAKELEAVLMQEMGPTCDVLFDTGLIFGVPEETVKIYEINSGVNIYKVYLIWNKIEEKYTQIQISIF